jgi:hypothetical protein
VTSHPHAVNARGGAADPGARLRNNGDERFGSKHLLLTGEINEGET